MRFTNPARPRFGTMNKTKPELSKYEVLSYSDEQNQQRFVQYQNMMLLFTSPDIARKWIARVAEFGIAANRTKLTHFALNAIITALRHGVEQGCVDGDRTIRLRDLLVSSN